MLICSAFLAKDKKQISTFSEGYRFAREVYRVTLIKEGTIKLFVRVQIFMKKCIVPIYCYDTE